MPELLLVVQRFLNQLNPFPEMLFLELLPVVVACLLSQMLFAYFCLLVLVRFGSFVSVGYFLYEIVSLVLLFLSMFFT